MVVVKLGVVGAYAILQLWPAALSSAVNMSKMLHFLLQKQRHFAYISLNMGPLSARTTLPPNTRVIVE